MAKMMTNSRHAKFKAYWEGQGKPLLEYKDEIEADKDFRASLTPQWREYRDYRIAGDRHWRLRKLWVDSGFKLRLESRDAKDQGPWHPCREPEWLSYREYRAVANPLEANSAPLQPETASADPAKSEPEPNTGALGRQEGGDHYRDMAIQPAEYIAANKLDFFQGNVVKYISRHKAKNGEQDIRKAIHFCEMILHFQYGGNKAHDRSNKQ